MNTGIDTVNVTQIQLKPREFYQFTVRTVIIVSMACFIKEVYLNPGKPALKFIDGLVQFGIKHSLIKNGPHEVVTCVHVWIGGKTGVRLTKLISRLNPLPRALEMRIFGNPIKFEYFL